MNPTTSLESLSASAVTPEVGMGIFVTFVLLITAIRLYLAYRQIRYVKGHRDTVPAAFADRIDLTTHQKAADYACAKARLSMIDIIVTAGILLWLTVGGGFDWLTSGWLYREDASIWVQAIALFAAVFVITTIISTIFDYYRVFNLETRFGFNRSTRRLWVMDQLKGLLLAIILGIPLLLLAVWVIDRAPTTWWLWLWSVLIVFNLAMVAIYPRFIAPLFNQFKPLDDPVLALEVESLLKANDFKVEGLYVMDGSRRSSHGNAYFTGFGATKRIVFFDTLLESLSHQEILAVLAHELGHLKKRHIWQRLISFAAFAFILLYGLYWLSQWPIVSESMNIHRFTIPVMLLLYMQLLPFLTFILTPILSWVSRKNEFEADEFASTQVPAHYLISGLVKLFGENASTLTPDPLYSAFYDSHPPASIRVAHLEKYIT